MDIKPLPNCLIVNIGDMTEILSNGKYKSTLHRVVKTSDKERYSIPFFFEPSFKAVIYPVCEEGEEPMVKPIMFGDYIQ